MFSPESSLGISLVFMGAFHYVRPSGRRPVELTKEKWYDIFHQKSISNRTEAIRLRFDRNFGYITVKWD